MTILFSAQVHVDYGQIYVESRAVPPAEYEEPRIGQVNGLVGAAQRGHLHLTTGLNTGTVWLTVEALDSVPPLADEWEEAVEVSFHPGSDHVFLREWGGSGQWSLPLKRMNYRVRYRAVGMDEGNDRGVRGPDESTVERYLLQFWSRSTDLWSMPSTRPNP